jgi:hypothetical protein
MDQAKYTNISARYDRLKRIPADTEGRGLFHTEY